MACPVFMTMEVSPQHHATVLGKGNINLKIIMQKTNTTIIFPLPMDIMAAFMTNMGSSSGSQPQIEIM